MCGCANCKEDTAFQVGLSSHLARVLKVLQDILGLQVVEQATNLGIEPFGLSIVHLRLIIEASASMHVYFFNSNVIPQEEVAWAQGHAQDNRCL